MCIRDSYYEDTGEFWPHNQPDQWYGMVSVSFAIQKSLNTVAVETGLKLGVQECFDFLQDTLGFTSLVERLEKNGLVYSDIAISPLALGSFTDGLSLIHI